MPQGHPVENKLISTKEYRTKRNLLHGEINYIKWGFPQTFGNKLKLSRLMCYQYVNSND